MDQKPISSTRIRPAFFFYATEAGAKLTTNARNQHPLLHCCNTRHAIDDESPVRMRSSLVIPNAEDQDKITSKDPAGNRLRAGHYGRTDWAAGCKGRHW